MAKVSIIIPARNEKYLEQTIRNVLDSAQGDIEVIAILDGYLPDPPIDMKDNRVRFLHYLQSIGQRKAINEGVKISSGKFIMKLDAHCTVDKGFDIKLQQDCKYDWTVVPRMYNLDIETWQPKRHKLTDYMYISPLEDQRPFRAVYYTGDEYKRQHRKKELIDDTMCCMGPGWFMHKDRFLELDGMDERHGSWGQMGIEVALKAWLSGGSLKVNKKTWFAHWFRGGGGPGFPYPISGKNQDIARIHSQDLWLNNKWEKRKRNFQWVIDKFKPPGWDNREEVAKKFHELNKEYYWHIIKRRHYPQWRGHHVMKYPSDLILYQQIIHKNRPDFIIETGTKWGGSAFFLADICELEGNGHVISIDKAPRCQPEHKRITYITGNSIDREIVGKVRQIVGDKKVMVTLDSKHTKNHVQWELHHYSKMVTEGQYLVVEDCYDKQMNPSEVMQARDWFLKRTKKFELEDLTYQFLVGITRDGWLKRK